MKVYKCIKLINTVDDQQVCFDKEAALVNINYRDSRPIYEQIKDQLRRMLISGAIAKDEKLPSVRDLASQMAINPNTIQRAYRDLEAEGLVYSVPGKGSFASGEGGTDPKRRAELTDKLKSAVSELKLMGVGTEEIIEIIREVEN